VRKHLPLSLDNVYVSNAQNMCIQKFDRDGNFIKRWGNIGKGDGQFNSPFGIAVDTAMNVYVSDELNACIQKFDRDGNFISKFGTEGSGDGQFNMPRDLVINSSDSVYISDGANHRVQLFSPAWKHIHDLDFFNELM
jgi:tripartite motif-containing protein 71